MYHDAVSLRIVEADLDDARHAEALVEIIDDYAREPGGQAAPLSEEAKAKMVPGLRATPNASVLLAFEGDTAVGAAVLLWSFSTFAGRRMVNVHDLAARSGHRGKGVGTALLVETERLARERDCCKVTLEVQDVNEGAKRLYGSLGFASFESPTWFLTRRL